MMKWKEIKNWERVAGWYIDPAATPHNEHCTVLGAACAGHRPERPLKQWTGDEIEQIATAYGL